MNGLCLVLPCNLYVVPYYKMYEDLFREININFDIIIWNRSLIEETSYGNIISYNVSDKANDKNPLKFFKYIGFAKFCRRTFKQKKYSKIIFLDTSSFCVIFLRKFLRRYYCKKYWVDVRDYTFENYSIYKRMIKTVLDNCFAYDVSSEGYLQFLPKTCSQMYLCHNVDYQTINKINNLNFINSDKIRISFIGNVRYLDINKRLLNLLKNDERFIVQYFGVGSEALEEFCKNNNIFNVRFVGRFPYEKTALFYCETDMINNIYGSETTEVKTALSNKLYYSSFLKKPILVSPNTFMCKIVNQYDLGFVVDLDDANLPNNLYNWYVKNYNFRNKADNRFVEIVEKEMKDFYFALKKFVFSIEEEEKKWN